MSNTPIYDTVVREQGWSPDDLRVPFDLELFVINSYSKVAAHRVLIAARDKEAAKNRPLRVGAPRTKRS